MPVLRGASLVQTKALPSLSPDGADAVVGAAGSWPHAYIRYSSLTIAYAYPNVPPLTQCPSRSLS